MCVSVKKREKQKETLTVPKRAIQTEGLNVKAFGGDGDKENGRVRERKRERERERERERKRERKLSKVREGEIVKEKSNYEEKEK